MEVAGLVLGAFPVAIWCLEKYAEPFETYTKYDVCISTFIAHLRVQETNLKGTLSSVGVDAGLGLSQDDLLGGIQRRFPSKKNDIMFLLDEMDGAMAGLLQSLKVDKNRKPTWIDAPPTRVSWEWRRVKNSLNSKRRDKLLQDLRQWNSDLKCLVEHVEIPAEQDDEPVRKAASRYNAGACDATRQSAKSLHHAVKSGVICDTAASHEASIELHWLKGALSSPETFSLRLGHSQDLASELEWNRFDAACTTHESQPQPLPQLQSPSPSLSSRLVLPVPPSPRRSPSPLASVRSLTHRFNISRRGSSRSADAAVNLAEVNHQENSAVTETLQGSALPINDLCAEFLKPYSDAEHFGYLEGIAQRRKASRFSLVHAEADCPRPIEAVPLGSMIGEPKQTHATALSRAQRYGIAASLASMVLHLSGSRWLGERWSEDQVKLFLQQDVSSGHQSLAASPHLSYHFTTSQNSRHADKMTNALSQLVPDKIILALGIILVELGVNDSFLDGSIEKLLDGDFSTLKARFQEKLDKVYMEHGEWYAYAAQRCVYGEFQGQTSQVNLDVPKFRQQFHSTVVAPLQATYEVFSRPFV